MDCYSYRIIVGKKSHLYLIALFLNVNLFLPYRIDQLNSWIAVLNEQYMTKIEHKPKPFVPTLSDYCFA